MLSIRIFDPLDLVIEEKIYPGIRVGHDQGRVCRDDELRALAHQGMDYRKESQLPIRRQRGLWLVNKIETVSAQTVAEQRQKRLPMGLLM